MTAGILWKAWNAFQNLQVVKEWIRIYFENQSTEIIEWHLNSVLAGCGISAGCFGLVILGIASYCKLRTNQETKTILHKIESITERKTTIRISGENLLKESNFGKSLNTQYKPNVEINLSKNGELVITQKCLNSKLDAIEEEVLRSAYQFLNPTNQPDIPVSDQSSSSAHCEQQTVNKEVIQNLTNQSDQSSAAPPSSDTAHDQQTGNEEDIQNQENQPDDHVSTRPSSSRAFQDKTSDLKME